MLFHVAFSLDLPILFSNLFVYFQTFYFCDFFYHLHQHMESVTFLNLEKKSSHIQIWVINSNLHADSKHFQFQVHHQ